MTGPGLVGTAKQIKKEKQRKTYEIGMNKDEGEQFSKVWMSSLSFQDHCARHACSLAAALVACFSIPVQCNVLGSHAQVGIAGD